MTLKYEKCNTCIFANKNLQKCNKNAECDCSYFIDAKEIKKDEKIISLNEPFSKSNNKYIPLYERLNINGQNIKK